MERSGLLLVKKEVNMTSHDCVNIVRRAFETKRAGHTGTLDPMASGLLPVCIGKATKTAELISTGDKEYRAGFVLGIRTDTLDITGEILEKRAPEKDEEKIRAAVLSFKGEYMQLPPMYSAKKINGKKLYELAREGKTVERKPSSVSIKEIELLSINTDENTVEIRVLCSKGTYIRSLIDDIGEKLSCLACMTSLERTGCGGYHIGDSRIVTVAELKCKAEALSSKLITPEEMFKDYLPVVLSCEEEARFTNGIRLRKENPTADIYRVLNKDNKLIALGKFFEEPDSDFRLGVYKSFY